MIICINLAERFGTQYRIVFDKSYDARRRRRETLDPWFMEIPCRKGTIYPFGGEMLAVQVDGRPLTAKRLLSLPGVRLLQDGDWERTFRFDVAQFSEVAAIVLPRRRRQISDAERQRL